MIERDDEEVKGSDIRLRSDTPASGHRIRSRGSYKSSRSTRVFLQHVYSDSENKSTTPVSF